MVHVAAGRSGKARDPERAQVRQVPADRFGGGMRRGDAHADRGVVTLPDLQQTQLRMIDEHVTQHPGDHLHFRVTGRVPGVL